MVTSYAVTSKIASSTVQSSHSCFQFRLLSHSTESGNMKLQDITVMQYIKAYNRKGVPDVRRKSVR